jgi:hypothetical protein
MFSEVDLNLTITNNVDYPVQINILGNPYNLLDTSNAKTEYQWDLTAFTFGTENSFTLQYKLNGAASFSIYTGTFTPQTLQAVVDVLNGLAIGFFSLYTIGANTYIGTYNDNYTFGDLNIYDSLGTAVNYNISQPNAGGNGLINSISGFISYTSPFTTGGILGFNASAGATVTVSGITDGITNTTITITQTDNSNLASTVIFNQLYTPLSAFNTNFVSQAGFNYLIEIS